MLFFLWVFWWLQARFVCDAALSSTLIRNYPSRTPRREPVLPSSAPKYERAEFCRGSVLCAKDPVRPRVSQRRTLCAANAAALEFQDGPRADDHSIRDRRDARGERVGYVTAGVDNILEIRLQRPVLR